MKNLFKWLQKYGYTYEAKTATGNYFYNVPELSLEAATIEINTADIKKLRSQQKKLEKHLQQYNYHIFIDARMQQYFDGTYHKFFYVTSGSNAAILEKYNIFADAARAECELLAHEYYKTGRNAEVNNALREIMDKYGAMYNRSFLKAIA